MAEKVKAEQMLFRARQELNAIEENFASRFPMLPGMVHHVEGMVRMTGLETDVENIVGVRLPLLKRVDFAVEPYSFLATPFWLDAFLDGLQTIATLTAKITIFEERYRYLADALNKTAQRVNLFEKVLIPQAQRDIQRIRIFLSDMERAEVVRAKLAKAKAEAH